MLNKGLSNTRVVVTGGAGFIGSGLVETLLLQDNEVVCLDNLVTGRKSNLEGFIKNKKFKFKRGDIRSPRDCRKAVDGAEYVVHLAALGSVPRSIKDPAATNDTNINGFLNMLIAARDEKVKRFIYASSSSVYGDAPGLPKVEEVTGNPLSPYAITKMVNEKYALNFSALYGIETIGLRFFNVFGRRQDPEGEYAAVIPRFVKHLMKHESPVIFGDGSQSRDFTYIDNVIQVVQLAALSTHSNAANTVYNVACGEQTTLNELYSCLVELLSKFDPRIASVKAKFAPERKGDIKHSLASIDKAKKYLQYNPGFNLKKGLELAIDWYYHNMK